MIVLNGEPRDGAPTVGELVGSLGVGSRGVAVAVDGEVVPRSEWASRPLADGARVEVVNAVQGG
ncbi:MAG: sulfur carrier protein ThiS [Actinobacteria bacterium]|nr:sulfur carrier protein ThiS [Actinomycetota bacterium]